MEAKNFTGFPAELQQRELSPDFTEFPFNPEKFGNHATL